MVYRQNNSNPIRKLRQTTAFIYSCIKKVSSSCFVEPFSFLTVIGRQCFPFLLSAHLLLSPVHLTSCKRWMCSLQVSKSLSPGTTISPIGMAGDTEEQHNYPTALWYVLIQQHSTQALRHFQLICIPVLWRGLKWMYDSMDNHWTLRAKDPKIRNHCIVLNMMWIMQEYLLRMSAYSIKMRLLEKVRTK